MTTTPKALSPEDIEGMEAGRELDALVAERVFGGAWEPSAHPEYDMLRIDGATLLSRHRVTRALVESGDPRLGEDWGNYSTRIEDAWQVVGLFEAEGFAWEASCIGGVYGFSFFRAKPQGTVFLWDARSPSGTGFTLPLAICRAGILTRQHKLVHPAPPATHTPTPASPALTRGEP